jgi:hypothetical protein
MRKTGVLIAIAVSIAAMLFQTGSALADSNPNITIQTATLESPFEVLVTGTSNCTYITGVRANLAENGGAFGSGVMLGTSIATQGANASWDVLVINPVFALLPFVKNHAIVQANAADCGGAANVGDIRTLLVN